MAFNGNFQQARYPPAGNGYTPRGQPTLYASQNSLNYLGSPSRNASQNSLNFIGQGGGNYPTKSNSRNIMLCCIVVVVVFVVVIGVAVTVAVLTLGAGSQSSSSIQNSLNPGSNPGQDSGQNTGQNPGQQDPQGGIDGDLFNMNTGNLNIECGYRPLFDSGTRNKRIVGGQQAISGKWPWQVSLRDANGLPRCGGFIIADKWVVTAAHCVDDPRAIIGAVFGDVRLSSDTQITSTRQYSEVLRVSVPTFWDPTSPTSVHDIALIELKTPIHFDDYVRPVCLAEMNDPHEVDHYGNCYATGWGYTQEPLSTDTAFNNYPDVLQEVELDIVSSQECSDIVGSKIFTENMICDSGDRNRGTCIGDSGGPLVCQGKQDNYWHVVGITSSGVGCMGNLPDFYTRITTYMDWICDVVHPLEEEMCARFIRPSK